MSLRDGQPIFRARAAACRRCLRDAARLPPMVVLTAPGGSDRLMAKPFHHDALRRGVSGMARAPR